MSDDEFPCAYLSAHAFLESFEWIPAHVIDATLTREFLCQLKTSEQPHRWLLYAAMQRMAEQQKNHTIARSNEERLDAFLQAWVEGDLPTDLASISRWLKYVPGNRGHKLTRRRAFQEEHRHELNPPQSISPDTVASQSDELAFVQLRTSTTEWQLLNAAAHADLKHVATAFDMPLGTLKSLLCRCRARIRRAS
jgi:hypothetical protein